MVDKVPGKLQYSDCTMSDFPRSSQLSWTLADYVLDAARLPRILWYL